MLTVPKRPRREEENGKAPSAIDRLAPTGRLEHSRLKNALAGVIGK